MNALRHALALLVEYRRSYLVLNAVYYGLVIVAMTFVAFNRDVQTAMLDAVRVSIDKGTLAPVGAAYASGVLPAAAMTFAVNLIGGSFASITLPSLLIPFGGLLIGVYRAALWGLIFAPRTLDVGAGGAVRGALVALLIALEGQGYVLSMLAAYVHGRGWLWPASVDAASRWQGYKLGVRRSISLYILIAATLAVAAIYEAMLVVAILPRLA